MAYDRGFNSIAYPDPQTFIFWFGAVPVHTAIFSTVPSFVNKPTCVQKSLNHWTMGWGKALNKKRGGKRR